ncbi:MAG TPA: hypothetical protein VMM57_04130 [Bacteroidota bacterium]|nr:hypothetical protein [Bacteroidota bacterium]
MRKWLLSAFMTGVLIVAAGCSSKPSTDEMKQLSDLQAEVASLQKDIAARQADKDALTKSIAEKDGQIVSCNKDKDALQQRMKGM